MPDRLDCLRAMNGQRKSLDYYHGVLVLHTSEIVWGLSGVIATVTLGLIVSAGGRPLINDTGLMQDFWMLVEHLLNTLLFLLGGLVWGTIIANQGDRTGTFTGKDWGYLVLLY
jgi:NhaP-type Na+/H+ or K+/H+ antiporter